MLYIIKKKEIKLIYSGWTLEITVQAKLVGCPFYFEVIVNRGRRKKKDRFMEIKISKLAVNKF